MIVLLAFLASICSGQKRETVTVTGHGYPVEQAFQDAWSDAVRWAGVRFLSAFSEVESGTKEDVSRFRQLFEVAVSRALIVKEDTLAPPRLLPGEQTGEKPMYEVTLRVTLMKMEEEDPYFNLTVASTASSSTYRHGETTSLLLESSKDCWITLFSVAADNSLWLIAPNPVQGAMRLRAHTPFAISDVQLSLPPDRDQTAELFFAVATKEPFPYVQEARLSQLWKTSPAGQGGAVCFARLGGATKLAEWLSLLPGREWTTAMLPYVIVK
jgi:hypothetical protein